MKKKQEEHVFIRIEKTWTPIDPKRAKSLGIRLLEGGDAMHVIYVN